VSGSSRWKVVLTDDTIHPDAIECLRTSCTVQFLHAYPGEAELIEACRDADAILARLGIITARVIESSPRLRIIARHGAGSDGVDISAATRHGVLVTTTGSINASAVAEYTIALLLALLRHIPSADAGMRAGGWSRNALVGEVLEGKTIGVIGFGAVGSRVARIAAGFGMRVVASTGSLSPVAPKPVPSFPLREMLGMTDIVTLHTRLTPATYGMIDATMIEAMKPGAVLVNTARGELVDETALIMALQSGHLAGAALDTYAVEPLTADAPLRRLPNVVLSPHVAGQTKETMPNVGLAAARAILDEQAGRQPAFLVNPEAYAARAMRAAKR
jgi:D-3-phosphoglycerate dehydrogenase / 2-oxoglutarate reductase